MFIKIICKIDRDIEKLIGHLAVFQGYLGGTMRKVTYDRQNEDIAQNIYNFRQITKELASDDYVLLLNP